MAGGTTGRCGFCIAFFIAVAIALNAQTISTMTKMPTFTHVPTSSSLLWRAANAVAVKMEAKASIDNHRETGFRSESGGFRTSVRMNCDRSVRGCAQRLMVAALAVAGVVRGFG